MNNPVSSVQDQVDDILAALNKANSKCLAPEEALESVGWLKIACRGLATIVIHQQERIERLEKICPGPGTDAKQLSDISSTGRPAEA